VITQSTTSPDIEDVDFVIGQLGNGKWWCNNQPIERLAPGVSSARLHLGGVGWEDIGSLPRKELARQKDSLNGTLSITEFNVRRMCRAVRDESELRLNLYISSVNLPQVILLSITITRIIEMLVRHV
jgi:hypothetical protein